MSPLTWFEINLCIYK